MCMTVRIGHATHGRVAFESVQNIPHDKGKYIAGFARDEDDAKRRANEYAGNDVVFICKRTDLMMHNVKLRRLGMKRGQHRNSFSP